MICADEGENLIMCVYCLQWWFPLIYYIHRHLNEIHFFLFKTKIKVFYGCFDLVEPELSFELAPLTKFVNETKTNQYSWDPF